MNIVLVGTGQAEIPPIGYGAVERHIAELGNELAREGHTVSIINRNFGSEYRFIPWALRAMRGREPDVIHIHTAAVASAFSLLHENLVFTSHNPSWTSSDLDERNRLGLLLERFIASRHPFIALESRTFAEVQAVAKFPHLVHGAIDAASWKGSRFEGYALSVGKLDPRKNFHSIGSLPDFRHIVAGKSIGNHRYERLLRERAIVLYPDPTERQLRSLYEGASVFVHPSTFDAFSIAVLEAMASGLPIIASGVCEDQVASGCNGFLVEDGDYASRIHHLLEDPGMAREMGRYSRRMVEDLFSWEVAVRKLVRIYEDAA